MGYPGGSDGKESAYDAGDQNWIWIKVNRLKCKAWSLGNRNKWWKCLCWTNNSLLFIFLLSLDLVLWLNFNNYEILSLCKYIFNSWAFLVAKIVISTCSARDLVLSLGWEDPLENEMAIHSSILSWTIPWTEEPEGYSP